MKLSAKNIVALFKLRRRLLAGLTADFQRLDVASFPGANLRELSALTSELHALGFVLVADFGPVRPAGELVTSCSRLLFHHEHRCHATVMQIIMGGKWNHNSTLIGSSLSEDWCVGTHNAPRNPAALIMRHPRIIGNRLVPARPANLLAAHLPLREKIARDLGLEVLPLGTYENHIAWLAKQAAERREFVRRKSTWRCMVEYFQGEWRQETEWLGDYPMALARKRAVA